MAKKDKNPLPAIYKPEYDIRIIHRGKKEKFTVQYARQNKHGNFDDNKFSSPERAHPDLEQALQNMAPGAASIMGLTAQYAARISVTKCSFDKTKEGAMTLAIDFDDAIPNMPEGAVAKVRTPAKQEMSDEADYTVCLSPDCVAAAILLRNEAVHFLEGKRSQEDLFDESEAEEEGDDE